MAFQDHFSAQAADYARHRPTYPAELFTFLALSCPDKRLAADVGSGNGQAAIELARFFDAVLAVEPSAEQLARAVPHERVRYVKGPAESLPLDDASAGLIAAGQAAHWFSLGPFYEEARRIASPQARIALWGYGRTRISQQIDLVVDDFYTNVVGPFWPPERALIENEYRDLAFPFRRMETPVFSIERKWSLHEFLGYVSSWSSVQRMRQATGADPLPQVSKGLAGLWTGQEAVRWPMALLLGAVHE